MKKIITGIVVAIIVGVGFNIVSAGANTTTTLKLPCVNSQVRVTVGTGTQAVYNCSAGFIEVMIDTSLFNVSPIQ